MTNTSDIQVAAHGLFVLQMHVTDRCNLRCTHCYQGDSLSNEMTLDQLLYVVDQFRSFCGTQGCAGQINFTGGEPFVRKDFIDLLETVTSLTPSLRFAIMTNGTLLTDKLAEKIALLRPVAVQISIDGSETTHDHIRGKGNYSKALCGLKCLHAHGVRSVISFTAHQQNFRDFPLVVKAARQASAARVWTDRLVPCGKGDHMRIMTPAQTQEFFNIVYQEQVFCAGYEGITTTVDMRRSLQFLVAGGRPYRCSAGERLLAIMPDGLVYPCRRLPIAIGNVLSTSLKDIYQNAQAALQRTAPCTSCQHRTACSGGSRCLAYATSGSLSTPDPGCWLY
jgi:radical SAM protein with 4Fe4S-binding SPASM domain